MRTVLLHLGQTPLMRRIVAAILLLGGVGIVTYLRAGGEVVRMELALNLASACAALAFLHVRWRKREQDQMTPAKAEDIFS